MTAAPSHLSSGTNDALDGLVERLDRLLLTSQENDRFVLSTESAANIVGIVREWVRTRSSPTPQIAGGVPDREAFWLVERMGTGLYVKFGPGDLTDNVWHAHRFDNERQAFDHARLSQAPWAKDLRATEHLFVNKSGLPPQAQAGETRVPKVRTSHHRNKEEAARLQKLVAKRCAEANPVGYWQMMYYDLLKRVDAGEFASPVPSTEGK